MRFGDEGALGGTGSDRHSARGRPAAQQRGTGEVCDVSSNAERDEEVEKTSRLIQKGMRTGAYLRTFQIGANEPVAWFVVAKCNYEGSGSHLSETAVGPNQSSLPNEAYNSESSMRFCDWGFKVTRTS